MSETARNVLIVGAGSAGNEIAKSLKAAKQKEYIPSGFIDNDRNLHGKRLQGLKVLGDLSGIKTIIRKNRVHEIFVAIPEATSRVMKEIMEASRIPDWEVRFKTVPSMIDIMSGKLEINQIRDVSIDDLLSRENIKLDDSNVKASLEGKIVMITGAGGSIGSELCYQVASYRPQKMVLLDMNEKNAFDIDVEIKQKHPKIEFVTVIGSITDRSWVESILGANKPHHIYHAAAYKHVHLMEWNPFTCIANNVLGTSVLADAAIDCGVEKFVMISTDKAVRPKGIMGLSKRIAERVVLEQADTGNTMFNVVRFGNVLGSSGSVVPFFQQQIHDGGPITVTHPEMTRYFMSIPEAVQLVLQAATLQNTGCIYLLEMGEPVKIVDLARSLVELSGLRVNEDIEIKYTGLRDGEKLYEELLTASENVLKTPYDKIRVQKNLKIDPIEVKQALTDLRLAAGTQDKELLNSTLKTMVPEAVT